ncbi:hypothetical protein JHK84_055419 [Glycine max]|nr:hypothetical protein JHK85_056392 [Glycine max]KAG5074188.1 hypothetical protein JHK84_055419 [Glycine max]
MEEMSRFRNEVRQAKQKHKKRKGSTKINLHKSKKRHKPDKRLSFPKRPSLSKGRTTTKHEQDLEDTKRSNIGTKKQTEEEWKIEVDKNTSYNGVSDNLHKNKNLPNKSKV